MRGCLQLLGRLAGGLFVVTAVFALFSVNLAQVVTSREAAKQILDPRAVVLDAAPIALAEAGLQQAGAQQPPPAPPDPAQLQTAISDLYPPGWLQTHGDRVVDALFDFLQSGNPGAAQVQIDAGPVVSRLRGEPGRRIVQATLEVLPRCSSPQAVSPPAADPSEVSFCLPPDVPLADTTRYTHDGLVELIDQTPALQGAGALQISLLGEGMPFTVSQQLAQQLHRLFTLGQQAWVLWLVPLACLLFLALSAGSLRDLGFWWGWPLLLAGAIALFVAIFLPPLVIATTLRWITGTQTLPRIFLGRLAQHVLDTLTDLWMGRVYVQAGAMAVAGLVLVAIDYFRHGQRYA